MNKLLIAGIVGGLTLVGGALFISLKTYDVKEDEDNESKNVKEDEDNESKNVKEEKEKEEKNVKWDDSINFAKKTKMRRNSTSNKRSNNLKSNTRRNNKKLI